VFSYLLIYFYLVTSSIPF